MDKYENAIAQQEKLIEILKRNYKKITDFKGVTGTGIGLRTKRNIYTDEFCLYVEVVKKLPLTELGDDQVIPETVEDVHVDVVQQQKKYPRDLKIKPEDLEFQNKVRPLEGGIQITNGLTNSLGEISVGTLGAMIFDPESCDDVIGMMSNSHVMYAFDAKKDQVIYQPLGNTGDNVGKNFKDKVIGGYDYREVDFAVARIDTAIKYTNHVKRIGDLTGLGEAVGSSMVEKFGRTTEYTRGTITRVGFTIIDNNFVYTGLEIVNGYNPIDLTKDFSAGGDSGAVIVDNNLKVVGLLWGGNNMPGNDITYANDIRRVTQTAGKFDLPVPIKMQSKLLFQDENRLKQYHESISKSDRGKEILNKFLVFNEEGRKLIAENRECMVTWLRNKGPDFIGLRIENGTENPYILNKDIEGISLADLMNQMAVVFKKHGSPEFADAINQHGDLLMEIINGSETVEEVIAGIGQNPLDRA